MFVRTLVGATTFLLAGATAAYASCSALGTGASNAVSGTFSLAAYNAVTGTTSALHVLEAVTIPYQTYHVLGVSSVPTAYRV